MEWPWSQCKTHGMAVAPVQDVWNGRGLNVRRMEWTWSNCKTNEMAVVPMQDVWNGHVLNARRMEWNGRGPIARRMERSWSQSKTYGMAELSMQDIWNGRRGPNARRMERAREHQDSRPAQHGLLSLIPRPGRALNPPIIQPLCHPNPPPLYQRRRSRRTNMFTQSMQLRVKTQQQISQTCS